MTCIQVTNKLQLSKKQEHINHNKKEYQSIQTDPEMVEMTKFKEKCIITSNMNLCMQRFRRKTLKLVNLRKQNKEIKENQKWIF